MQANIHYPTLLRDLRIAGEVEKIAALDDERVNAAAAVKHAEISNELVVRMLKLSSAVALDQPLLSKEAAAAKMVKFVVHLRSTHELLGEKLAADVPVNTGLKKLATAVYLDQLYTEEIPKLAAEQRGEAESQQLLGREYIVDIMRGLLA